ncbi:MAG: DUF3037 domain-containing protein [Verrucomicrobiaceae bacterium]|nr:DUF3037 domain-containing protein [Verrucomicrobiaceae bacterium]
MHLILHYAAIGFRPYPELGEFVNVGIVAVEAKSRYLRYQLIAPQRTRRIRVCFPELDLSLYRSGLRRLESELAALSIETNLWSDDARQVAKNHPAQIDLFVGTDEGHLFERLTAPQGSPFFYASRGTRLCEDMDQALAALYDRYVDHRHLHAADYEEKQLTRDLRRLFQANRLGRIYREAPWVGTDAYHVGIPLAFTPKGSEVPEKAIKPLNLDRPTPTPIYTYGDEWIAKVNRLRRVGCLPGEFLFVVKKPEDGEGRVAAEDICEGLIREGVQVADFEDTEAILAFARIEEQPELKLTS